MTKEQALEKLRGYELKSFALNHARGMVSVDGSTHAPKGSAEIRPITMGEIGKLSYELATCPETIEMLETLNSFKDDLPPLKAREVSELSKNLEKTKKVPKDLFIENRKILAQSGTVWREAKAKNDFAMFEPYLQQVFDYKKKIYSCYNSGKTAYDACLEECEKGWNTNVADNFFSQIKAGLIPLIKAIKEQKAPVDNAPIKKYHSLDSQRKLSHFLTKQICIDENFSAIAETEHPYTSGFSKKDARINTHFHEYDIMSGVCSVLHEGGHALYNLHSADELMFTCLAGGASSSMHESQSRFFENMVGRSKEFLTILLAKFKEMYPEDFTNVNSEDFYKMVNLSSPSLIRLDADELTYCIHIVIRYELEKLMMSGDIKAKDLPQEWNRLYKEYLGLDVPTDRQGVLQDSHWSDGLIGYFPAYAIGSAYGPQFVREMNKDFDFSSAIADGNIIKVNNWLEEKIWKYGKTLDSDVIYRNAAGGELDPKCYIDYLSKKFKYIYNI